MASYYPPLITKDEMQEIRQRKAGEYWGSTFSGGKVYERLEFLFLLEKIKERGWFYKYTTPCKDRRYRHWDSLENATKLCRQTINKEKRKFCTCHPSKTAYDKAEDKFKGMPMACYYNRETHQLVYVKNEEVFNKAKKDIDLAVELEVKMIKAEDRKRRGFEKKASKAISNYPFNSIHYKKLTMLSPDTHIDTNIHTNTTLETLPLIEVLPSEQPPVVLVYQQRLEETPQRVKSVPQTPLPVLIRQEMVEIFETATEKKVPYPEKFDNRCLEYLRVVCNARLEKWKEICETTARNAYLMGKIPGKEFDLTLHFLLNKERTEKILGGYYGMNTWIQKYKPKSEIEKLRIKKTEKKQQLSGIQKKKTESIREIEQGRMKTFNEEFAKLTTEEKKNYKAKFYEQLPADAHFTPWEQDKLFENTFLVKEINKKLNYSPDIAPDPELLQKEQQLLNEIAQLDALEEQLIREEKEKNQRVKSLTELFYKSSNGKGNFVSA